MLASHQLNPAVMTTRRFWCHRNRESDEAASCSHLVVAVSSSPVQASSRLRRQEVGHFHAAGDQTGRRNQVRADRLSRRESGVEAVAEKQQTKDFCLWTGGSVSY